MIRITTLLWIALLVVAGGTVMRVSYQVKHAQDHLAQLGRDIQREQDTIRILDAEWNTLNDPERIDALAKRYLPLQSTPIQRVVALDDIPLKPTPEQLAQMEKAKAAKTSQVRTASAASARVARPVEFASPSSASREPPHAAVPVAAVLGTPEPALGRQGLVYVKAERRE